MLHLLLLFVFIVSGKKKAPLSLKDVLQKTQGQLDGLSSSLSKYSKHLGKAESTASNNAQKATKKQVDQIHTDLGDYTSAMKELMGAVNTEMKDYERELRELEFNQADDIKGLGKAVKRVTGEGKTELSKLMNKLEKVLADMKAQEKQAEADKKATDAAASDAAPAASDAAPAASDAAPAASDAAPVASDAAPVASDAAPVASDAAPVAADAAPVASDAAPAASDAAPAASDAAPAASDAAPAASDAAPAASDEAPVASDAGSDAIAQALIIDEASSWVSSHFVLTLFILLGAALVYAFWGFQHQYSPLYNAKESDSLVFTSQYYQATATNSGFKKQY